MRLPSPTRTLGSLINAPLGIIGRNRPFYLLNLVERLRGPRDLAEAVGGRVVVVTGASSGIGEAAALRIGSAGGTVVLVARTEDKLRDVAARVGEAGGTAYVEPCDLTDPAEIDRMATRVIEGYGGIDILINNAGHSIRRSVTNSFDRVHDYERTIQLNYLGAVRLTLAALEGMTERGSGQVINISSAGVAVGTPRFSGYLASKAALDTFAECIGAELAHRGIRMSTIHMPLVRTPMIGPSRNHYRQIPSISADQAADWIARTIVHRPRVVGPSYASLAALSNLVSPAATEAVRNAGYRLGRDSRAAKGEASPTRQDQTD